MRIDFEQRGGCKAHFPVFERHIRAVLPEMTSTRMINTMWITVKFVKTALVRRKSGRAGGTATHHEYSKKTNGNKRKHLVIKIRRDKRISRQLTTCTHELMHCVQYASGRLKHRTIGGTKYWIWRPVGHKGKSLRYVRDRKAFLHNERPWEIEANTAQRKYDHIAQQSLRGAT